RIVRMRGGGRRPTAASPSHPMSNLTKQLRWYIAVRVVAIGSVLIPYGLIQIGPTSAPPVIEGSTPPAASVITTPAAPVLVGPPAPPPEPELLRPEVVFQLGGLTLVATLVYIALLRILRDRPTVQAYIQFSGDLLLI